MSGPLLGVNIDHVATLRQVRGTPYPVPLEAAKEAEAGGADFITVHLREDRRHIVDSDVPMLISGIDTYVNLEIAATEEMVAIACRERPHSVVIVPERRQEITTEGGLDVAGNLGKVRDAVAACASSGIEVSLFIDPLQDQIDSSVAAGADVVEFHTGRYAEGDEGALQVLEEMSAIASAAGLKVNAGHGLHLDNVAPIAAIPSIAELNIGHSIVARAVFVGLRAAVAEMKAAIEAGRS